MSRMLDALKTLETRQQRNDQGPDVRPGAKPAENAAPAEQASAVEWDAPEANPDEAAGVIEPQPSRPVAAFESCTLPTSRDVADCYLEMAAEISDQQASNYCNVLLFVGTDRWVEPSFSMTQLAQAFALQSAGDVLLVDGDLRFGRLSKSVARPGPGMIEAMLGQAEWPDIIHPTSAARIDFVTCGNGPVPTVERPGFGWGALRPLYRAVLIGLADHAEPETSWLGARCDAVYLALSRPHTRRAHASAAVNALRASGANVAGSIVVND